MNYRSVSLADRVFEKLEINKLEPKEEFVDFLVDLKTKFENIVVVNDGSSEKYDKIFNDISKKGIIVLKNHINLGKGRALKYGINHILNVFKECKVIVTADSDGQHTSKDIQSRWQRMTNFTILYM